MTKEISAILAIGPRNVIGKGDKLAWYSKVDLEHFKKITTGNACLFGDTTFFGLPIYPLKNRLNLVLKKDLKKTTICDGYVGFNNVDKALKFCENYDKIFFCGGKSIYEHIFNNDLINTIYLTKIYSEKLEKEIDNNIEDYIILDVDFNKLINWLCVESQSEIRDGDLLVKFLKYSKK